MVCLYCAWSDGAVQQRTLNALSLVVDAPGAPSSRPASHRVFVLRRTKYEAPQDCERGSRGRAHVSQAQFLRRSPRASGSDSCGSGTKLNASRLSTPVGEPLAAGSPPRARRSFLVTIAFVRPFALRGLTIKAALALGFSVTVGVWFLTGYYFTAAISDRRQRKGLRPPEPRMWAGGGGGSGCSACANAPRK